MDVIDVFIAAILTGISFLLLLLMSLAYVRIKNVKLLFLTGGFAVFFIEGVLLILSQTVFNPPPFSMSRELMLLNLIIVLLFYAGTVKR